MSMHPSSTTGASAAGHAGRSLAVLLSLALAGCLGPGLLYTNVTEPLTEDFAGTPVGTRQCVVANHRVREPVTAYSLSVDWPTGRIKAAARDAGITRVYGIDQRTFSVLLGIYRRTSYVVYGD